VISGTASLSNDIGWIKLHVNPETERSVHIKDVTEEWACISLWGSLRT